MRTTVWVSLAFSVLGWADGSADRAAIERVISALNIDSRGLSQQRTKLFTTDADNELDRLSNLDRRLSPPKNPWSEVTTPRIVVQSVRFITSDVALVEATITQYGSIILVRRVPLLLVMKKEARDWRIASLRVMVDFNALP
jgi:hypothetical protein